MHYSTSITYQIYLGSGRGYIDDSVTSWAVITSNTSSLAELAVLIVLQRCNTQHVLVPVSLLY